MMLTKQEKQAIRAIRRAIGANMQAVRMQKRITLQRCARITGISIAKLDKYEMGKDELNIPALVKISGVLEVTLDFLLDIKPSQ